MEKSPFICTNRVLYRYAANKINYSEVLQHVRHNRKNKLVQAHGFRDYLPNLFDGYRNENFKKLLFDNMVYFHTKLYKF